MVRNADAYIHARKERKPVHSLHGRTLPLCSRRNDRPDRGVAITHMGYAELPVVAIDWSTGNSAQCKLVRASVASARIEATRFRYFARNLRVGFALTLGRRRFGARMVLEHGMTTIVPLEKFHVPLGGQDIELQQIDYAGGGMSLLRVRIREGKRFTIFDIDPVTAAQIAGAIQTWAGAQLRDVA